jgi:hypothetical protein
MAKRKLKNSKTKNERVPNQSFLPNQPTSKLANLVAEWRSARGRAAGSDSL